MIAYIVCIDYMSQFVSGFESTLPECVTKGGPEDLSKHNEEKCEEAEENLAACDADCSPATLCTQSDKQIGKLWDKFDKKCLKKGYATTLSGCQPEENSEHKSNDRHCGKLEQELANCGVNCPVDGGWGDFGDWSECSVECGVGEMTRERECDNPAPENGGAKCEGAGTETMECQMDPCPEEDTEEEDEPEEAELKEEEEEDEIEETKLKKRNGGAELKGDDLEPCPRCGRMRSQRSRNGGAERKGDDPCPLDPCTWCDCDGSEEKKPEEMELKKRNGGTELKGDDLEPCPRCGRIRSQRSRNRE